VCLQLLLQARFLFMLVQADHGVQFAPRVMFCYADRETARFGVPFFIIIACGEQYCAVRSRKANRVSLCGIGKTL